MSTLLVPSGSFLKNLFVKSCFVLGLGTAAYYSFSGLKGFFGTSETAISQGGLRDKVESLSRNAESPDAGAFRSFAYNQSGPPAAFPLVGAVAPGSPTNPEALPGPSPGASPVPGDAVAQASPEGEQSGNGDAAMAYSFDPQAQPWYPQTDSGNGAESPRSEQASRVGNSDSNPASVPMVGGAVPYHAPGTNSGYSNSGAQASALSQRDLSLLTATNLRAVFNDANPSVTGAYYANGIAGGVTNNAYSMTVHESRWAPNKGIEGEAAFAITGSSRASLSVHLGLKIQADDGSVNSFVGSSSPTQFQARTEFRNGGHPFRVFEMTLANLAVAGETLRQVHVVIAFDISDPNSTVVAQDSTVSFVRTSVPLSSIAWDYSTHAALASTDPVLVAASAPYSMTIEKLP